MSILLIAEIIAKFGPSGISLAKKLWELWAAKSEPTAADWAELEALGAQTMESQVLSALARNGVAVTDPRAVELMKLIKP